MRAAITTGHMMVFGEITTSAHINIDAIARQKVRDIGYTSAEIGFDADRATVVVLIDEQSPDIRDGVDTAWSSATAAVAIGSTPPVPETKE